MDCVDYLGGIIMTRYDANKNQNSEILEPVKIVYNNEMNTMRTIEKDDEIKNHCLYEDSIKSINSQNKYDISIKGDEEKCSLLMTLTTKNRQLYYYYYEKDKMMESMDCTKYNLDTKKEERNKLLSDLTKKNTQEIAGKKVGLSQSQVSKIIKGLK